MKRLLLGVWIVALAGCHPRTVAQPASPPQSSNWVLSASANPDDRFCVEWTVDVDAGDSRPYSCMSVATIRRLVRGQRNAE